MTERPGRSTLWAIMVLLALWTALAAILKLPIIPSPFMVAETLTEIFGSVIMKHTICSIMRIFLGVTGAVIAGVVLGTLMGYFPFAGRLFSPLVYFTYPVPKVAFLPVIMLIFGVGETAKLLLIFLIVVYQVTLAVRDGIKEIPEEMFFPLYSLGASFTDIFRHLLLPAVLPKFFTALRVAVATAVSVLFFTETFGTDYGIGFFIMDAWLRVNYLEMYAGIVVLSSLGFLIFLFIDSAERKLCCWQ